MSTNRLGLQLRLGRVALFATPSKPFALTPLEPVDTPEKDVTLAKRLDGERRFGVLAQSKKPSLCICFRKRKSRLDAKGMLLAVMTANREPRLIKALS